MAAPTRSAAHVVSRHAACSTPVMGQVASLQKDLPAGDRRPSVAVSR
jgi:hypothetical protein